MSVVVQKYGGTSVASIARIQRVAKWIIEQKQREKQLVVVVSAMAGETDRLEKLVNSFEENLTSAAHDLVLSAGEQISCGLLSLAIDQEAKKQNLIKGQEVLARPMLAYQIPLKTDSLHSKARIQSVAKKSILKELLQNKVSVIAGYQGVDDKNFITTLGRGGSDTSAVAIAAAIDSKICEIYTDVDGIFSYARAIKRKSLSYQKMLEMANSGSIRGAFANS